MRSTGSIRKRAREARRTRLWGAVPAALVAWGVGCATVRVDDLEAYEPLPMNRVVPYPSPEELAKRAYDVVIVERDSPGIDAETLAEPRRWARRELEGIASGVGATIIDRSLQDVTEIRTEGVLGEIEGRRGDLSGADYAIASRFSTYRYTTSWQPPFKFLWQSPEDVEGRDGTCTHLAEIVVDVQLIEIGRNDRVAQTYALEHRAERETSHPDESCPFSPAATSMLFEQAMDEALSCLRLPLGRLLAPRGHVTAHRKARESDRHLYRVSLGSAQGLETGAGIEVRRVQHSSTPSGEAARSERVIAEGVVTDRLEAQQAWVALDPAEATEEILDGDVVRPVLYEGLLSSLSGPSCSRILEER